MVVGKNLPIINEMYLAETGKEGLKKDGTPKKELIEFMKAKDFKTMKPTVVKNFGGCTLDIDTGKMTAEECYESAKEKAFETGSVYIPPALRTKKKAKAYEEKYPPIKF